MRTNYSWPMQWVHRVLLSFLARRSLCKPTYCLFGNDKRQLRSSLTKHGRPPQTRKYVHLYTCTFIAQIPSHYPCTVWNVLPTSTYYSVVRYGPQFVIMISAFLYCTGHSIWRVARATHSAQHSKFERRRICCGFGRTHQGAASQGLFPQGRNL